MELKELSQFVDYPAGSRFPEYSNFVISIIEMMEYYEVTMDGLMNLLKQIDGGSKYKESLDKRKS